MNCKILILHHINNKSIHNPLLMNNNFIFFHVNMGYEIFLKVTTVVNLSNGNWTLFPSSFMCLFVYGFTSHSRIFHSYGYVTIAGERLFTN